MGRSPRLAIVGASARAAAESAIRGGFRVVAADLFADADLRAVCPTTRIGDYPFGLADWLAEQEVDGWLYTGALENHPDLVDALAAVRPLLGVLGAALRRSRDPLALQRVFRDARIPFPETEAAENGPSADGDWLAKSYRGAAGSGVGPAEGRSPGGYRQRLVTGEPTSAVFAVGPAGATLLAFSVQLVGLSWTNAPAWGYCGSIGPLAPTPKQRAALDEIGEALRDPLGLVGVIGVDLIAAGDALTVIEINPRFPASAEMRDRRSGDSVVAAHVAACRGEAVSGVAESGSAVLGKLVWFAPRPATVGEAFADWLRDEHAEGRAADLPDAGAAIDAGAPVCTLLEKGTDSAAVRRRLRQRANEAQRRLES